MIYRRSAPEATGTFPGTDAEGPSDSTDLDDASPRSSRSPRGSARGSTRSIPAISIARSTVAGAELEHRHTASRLAAALSQKRVDRRR
jgi:hypothetical protein